MVRQILQSKTTSNARLGSLSTETAKQEHIDPLRLERVLRKNRSKKYMSVMAKLDAGGHVTNQRQVEDIINSIADEFEELDMNLTGMMKGIVAPCYLGIPYEVHTLDYTHKILEHYPSGKRLPGDLEKARGVAMRGGYAFIEVYEDFCCAVSSSGSVSIVKF